jgi:hypothetical protein
VVGAVGAELWVVAGATVVEDADVDDDPQAARATSPRAARSTRRRAVHEVVGRIVIIIIMI